MEKKWKLLLGILYFIVFLIATFNFKGRCRVDILQPLVPDTYSKDSKLQLCQPSNLGLVKVDIFADPSYAQIEAENAYVQKGGLWKPSDCFPWQRVAVIIPYRDRSYHLRLLMHRIHPMMQRQKLHYQVFVVEQMGMERFNRGRLMNIGYVEALKLDKFDCFVFHDVDLLPENDENLYMCDGEARHLAAAIDEMRYHLMYYNYAGGVIAVNRSNFQKMNGYSNDYWGWGKEDDDFSARTMGADLMLTRPPIHIGRYKMVRHEKQYQAPHGYELFLTWRSRWHRDGLSSIEQNKYRLTEKKLKKLYTLLRVDLGKPPEKPPVDENAPRENFMWFLQYFYP